LQGTLDYLINSDKGQILITEPVRISDTIYQQTVLVSNFDDKMLSGLEFNLSDGVFIEVNASSGGTKPIVMPNTFKLERVAAGTTVTINTEYRANSPRANLAALNYKDNSLDLIQNSRLDPKPKVDWLSIFASCIFYTVIYYILIFTLMRK
jgi:hypothetical protein